MSSNLGTALLAEKQILPLICSNSKNQASYARPAEYAHSENYNTRTEGSASSIYI